LAGSRPACPVIVSDPGCHLAEHRREVGRAARWRRCLHALAGIIGQSAARGQGIDGYTITASASTRTASRVNTADTRRAWNNGTQRSGATRRSRAPGESDRDSRGSCLRCSREHDVICRHRLEGGTRGCPDAETRDHPNGSCSHPKRRRERRSGFRRVSTNCRHSTRGSRISARKRTSPSTRRRPPFVMFLVPARTRAAKSIPSGWAPTSP
jgi:hypothetical protein